MSVDSKDIDLVERLATVRRGISDACSGAGRDADTVTLVAASKTVGAGVLQRTIGASQVAYGENRIQEARAKWPALRASHPNLELHMIGPLQTNKVRDAVALFDVIQSVDRSSLAKALSRQCSLQGLRPSIFVQVNTGREPQKAGADPGEIDRFVAECRELHDLHVVGLMCVPPADDEPGRHFTLLREAAARNALACLSMGMSADFAIAIEHGATHVRIGSSIFGPRI